MTFAKNETFEKIGHTFVVILPTHILSHVQAHIRSRIEAHIRNHIKAHIGSHINAPIPSHIDAQIRTHDKTRAQKNIEITIKSKLKSH